MEAGANIKAHLITARQEGDATQGAVKRENLASGEFIGFGRLAEISNGDKRVLVIGGEPVPFCLARIPQPGETRGNLAAGGTGVARELTARDREIAETLGPQLMAAGLLLVGLDVIGDCLTEVNVTSPTCFQEITQQTGFNVAGMLLNKLENLV